MARKLAIGPAESARAVRDGVIKALIGGECDESYRPSVTLATADGQVVQRAPPPPPGRDRAETILAALEPGEPARFFDFTVPNP